MASESCAGCFGTGKSVNGGYCSFCAGTGNIWVPDKTSNYSRPVGRSRNSQGSGPSWLDNAFEDNLASICAIVVWGIFMYHGLDSPDTKWYIPFILGIIAGFVTYKLVSGPLRPIATIIKYVCYLALILAAIYGIYITITVILDLGSA